MGDEKICKIWNPIFSYAVDMPDRCDCDNRVCCYTSTNRIFLDYLLKEESVAFNVAVLLWMMAKQAYSCSRTVEGYHQLVVSSQNWCLLPINCSPLSASECSKWFRADFGKAVRVWFLASWNRGHIVMSVSYNSFPRQLIGRGQGKDIRCVKDCRSQDSRNQVLVEHGHVKPFDYICNGRHALQYQNSIIR